MIHDRQKTKTCLFPSNQLLEANNLLHYITSKTYSSIITALFCVRFDVVITDIKQQNVLITVTSMWIYIYIYMFCMYLCVFVCVIFTLFHLSHYVRNKHKALHCIMANSIAVWNGPLTLKWRHNERDGVSNQRRLDWLHIRLFRRRSKKTSKLRVTGLC